MRRKPHAMLTLRRRVAPCSGALPTVPRLLTRIAEGPGRYSYTVPSLASTHATADAQNDCERESLASSRLLRRHPVEVYR